MTADAERTCKSTGVVLRLGGGIRGGHDRCVDALGAQGVGCHARHESGVDPSGESQDDLAKLVLFDVVAQPQHECGVHLRLDGIQQLGDLTPWRGRDRVARGAIGRDRRQDGGPPLGPFA